MRTQIYIVNRNVLFEIESFPLMNKAIDIDCSVLSSAKVLFGSPTDIIADTFNIHNIRICKDENGFYQYIWAS